MAAAVIDHLLATKYNAQTAVLYVFCNYKRRDEQTKAHFLRALLRQMVYAKRHVPQVVQQLYDQHVAKNTQPSFDELSKVADTLVRDFGRVHIVIDALDECENATRCGFLTAILQMQTLGKVKLSQRLVLWQKYEIELSQRTS